MDAGGPVDVEERLGRSKEEGSDGLGKESPFKDRDRETGRMVYISGFDPLLRVELEELKHQVGGFGTWDMNRPIELLVDLDD
eukprot:762062-Hanusia_phi.AAC.3